MHDTLASEDSGSNRLSTDPPIELIEHLNRGDCVLFVGDALADESSPSVRLASALVNRGSTHAACPISACRSGKCIQPEDCAVPLAHAAQFYESCMGRQALLDFTRRFIDERYPPRSTSPIHHKLASLPIRIVITTAYDDRLEMALDMAGRPYSSVVRDSDVPFDDPGRVQLIRLHGTVRDPQSLVLTEDDRVDLFARLPVVTKILQGHFASQTLLFVGYGLGDPHFLELYRQVTEPVARLRRLSFAVQWPPNPLATSRWRDRIMLLDERPLGFIERLTESVRLQADRREPGALPPEPYKFLDYYTQDDAAIFFGRDLEAELLLSTVLAHRLTVFYGRSGTGKTSLLLARVSPALQDKGHHLAYARMLGDPADEVKAAIRGLPGAGRLSHQDQTRRLADVITDALPLAGRLVVVLDQFEEFFVRQSEAVRHAFAHDLADCLQVTDSAAGLGGLDVRFVLSLRDDYLGLLDELSAALPGDVFAHRFKLEILSRAQALQAILKPAKAFGLPVEEALRERLITDLEDQGLEPTNLQIVLFRLYRDAVKQGLWSEADRRGIGLTLTRYEALGGTRAILIGYLDEVLAELPQAEQQLARAVLKSMVTTEQTKMAVSRQEIAFGDLVAKLGLDDAQVTGLVAHLRKKRVVRKLGEEDRYELAHEVMVEKVWAWFTAEELKLLDTRDMLQRELANYRRFGLLMSSEKLALVYEQFGAMQKLTADELELLQMSALVQRRFADVWGPGVRRLDTNSRVRLLKAIANLVREQHDDETHRRAIQFLASVGDEASISYLVETLYDADFGITRLANEALRSFDPEKVSIQLGEKCLDSDPKNRLRAASSLRRLETALSTRVLQQLKISREKQQVAWLDEALRLVACPRDQVPSGTPLMSCLALSDGSTFASGIITALVDRGYAIDIVECFRVYDSPKEFFRSVADLLDYQVVLLFRGDWFSRGSAAAVNEYLLHFIAAGGTLIATPWVAWEDTGYLDHVLPVRIKPLLQDFLEDQPMTWYVHDVDDPLCRGLTPVVRLRGSYESLSGTAGATVVIADSQGNPALAIKRTGLGQVIYVNICGHDCQFNPWQESIETRLLFSNVFDFLANQYCTQASDEDTE